MRWTVETEGTFDDEHFDISDVPYHRNMPIVIKLTKVLYDLADVIEADTSCGGVAHVVLDDDNFKDKDIDFVIKWAQDDEHKDKPESKLAVCIMEYLKEMSYEQRAATFILMDEDELTESLYNILREIHVDDTV